MSWGNIKNTVDERYCPWDIERFSSELLKFYKSESSSVKQEGSLLIFTKEHYLTPSFQDKFTLSFRLSVDTSENSMTISIKPESPEINSFLLHKGFKPENGYYRIKDLILDDYNRPLYWYSERKIRSFLTEVMR